MMINWKNVRLIFLREGRDQLRDRRTLFMIAVLPLLLYPALGIGMVQLTVLFSEQSRTVVLLGEKDLPGPPLLQAGHFAPNWFRHREDAEKLEVVTDGTPAETLAPSDAAHRAEVLEHAREIRRKIELKERLDADRDEIERQLKDSQNKQSVALAARLQSVTQQLHDVQTELGKLFSASQIQVLVIIPEGFAENIARVNQSLAKRDQHEPVADYARPVIVHNKADEKSQIAVTRVRDVMDRWEDEILKRRLELAQLPSSLPNPVKPKHEDVALETQVAANVWSKLFPALLVIMSITGAFYPAIDLCAGEKERGTMETLLICPATRTEIVLGKFFTVLCFSISTAVLNLMSMGLTGQHMASMVHVGGTDAGLSFPSWPALAAIILFLIPLASLFSALCLSLATFARSSKEGQYYLTPLLMGTLGLTVFCLSPGVELTPFYSIMPVAGVSLLLKGLLLAQADSHHLYWYAIPVLGTTFIYSALALWWAIDQFQREDVLFREAERFELGLWIRHLLRDKEPTPSFTEAGFCFVLIMLLQFASFKAMAQASTGGGTTVQMDGALRTMLIQQIAIIASPALFMGIMLTTSMVRTFRFRLPRLDLLACAGLLAVVLHPVSLELVASLHWFFPPLPPNVAQLMQGMTDPNQPLWKVLLVFAVAPGICEELAFRGFILSGFQHNGRRVLAVVMSSLAFGVIHMIPQQVFNATLLGLVLGLIAIRTGSLLPCMLFHLTFNGLAVLHGRVATELGGMAPNPFFYVSGGHLRYGWPTVLFAAVMAALLISRLIRRPDLRSEGARADRTALEVPQLAGNWALSSTAPRPHP